MNTTLFTNEGVQQLYKRIDQLTPQSQRQWGKMNVSQMLEHCQKPLEVAVNAHLLKQGLMMKILSALMGKKVKAQYMSAQELKKNSPTSPDFIIKNTPDFEAAKQKLKDDIQIFSQKGITKQLGDKHPFFGPMTHEEWNMLQWKHLDHHLKQFGV